MNFPFLKRIAYLDRNRFYFVVRMWFEVKYSVCNDVISGPFSFKKEAVKDSKLCFGDLAFFKFQLESFCLLGVFPKVCFFFSLILTFFSKLGTNNTIFFFI